MASNLVIAGNTYPSVPSILIPKDGGGTARFDDASVTTAVESDVASGKKFLKTDGSIGTGSLVFSSIHTGSSAPSSSLGANGDVYLQIGS